MRTLDIIVADKTYHVDLASLSGRPLQVCIDGQPLEVSIRQIEEYNDRSPKTGNGSRSKPCTEKPVAADIHFNHYPE